MDEDKYLIVKGLAGLGNRMLSALTGIVYARLSGRRLIIDWSDSTYSRDGSNAFHQLFTCPSCDPEVTIPATGAVYPKLWSGNLDKSLSYMRTPGLKNEDFWCKTSIDISKIDYDEDILIMWSYHQKIYLLRDHFISRFKEWAGYSDEAVLRMLLRKDLVPNAGIQERIYEFRDRFFKRKIVGVHVRYADHQVSLLSILARLDSLLKQEPGLSVFLATDNIQVKNLFEENYPNVITANHWYPVPGQRIHDNKACPDRLQSAIESVMDLYLLAECDYLILDTSSSFSVIAQLLAKTESSQILDMKKRDKLTPALRRFYWRMKLRIGLFSWGLKILSKLERSKKYLNQ